MSGADPGCAGVGVQSICLPKLTSMIKCDYKMRSSIVLMTNLLNYKFVVTEFNSRRRKCCQESCDILSRVFASFDSLVVLWSEKQVEA